jgi:site-specific recombinase XerD
MMLKSDDTFDIVTALQRKGLSKQTINAYSNGVRLYHNYLKQTGQAETPKSVRSFLLPIRYRKPSAMQTRQRR